MLAAGLQAAGAGELNLKVRENAAASNHAVVEIVSPREGEVLPADKPVMLEAHVKGFVLGELTPGAGRNGLAFSAKGQHLHVIVDGGPYAAVYDVSKPFDLGKLKPGLHTIEAFASRAWHEAVKSPGARRAVTFYVAKAKGRSPYKPGAPLLTYSRPKGTYVGDDARMIMIDFYLTNATLGPKDYRVRVSVDGDSTIVDRWQPYHVEGLAKGEHEIQIELIDHKGKRVSGKHNSTQRTIEVR